MTTIRLAVLDMAGTTVADDGLVVRAFDEAATAVGLPESGPERDDARRYVLDTMGQSKIVVFRALFGSDERARIANDAFERAYERFVDAGDVAPIPGAERTITQLREAGVKVALTTGFSRSTQDRLLDALGWRDLADIALTPADAGRGRPYPDMILTALLRTGTDDVRETAVVGDTAGDMLSGLRSGASVVAGTRTGAHDEATLREAGATHVLDSIVALPALIVS
ncbi:phosphonatase-like hydrolase [Rhodococcus sp. Q1]|uniref:phosphonatase-like hydrolase n=1 Tax=Rhodococcus sp. Q1 TaxID=2508718 RepID=UPI00102236D3|nr:phosphonatase-like hydrolase [Rhodococcus sp. Q1]